MKYLDRRISPWFLPLLFVVVLLCINWMGGNRLPGCVFLSGRRPFSPNSTHLFSDGPCAGCCRAPPPSVYHAGLLGDPSALPAVRPILFVPAAVPLVCAVFPLAGRLISHRQCRFSLAAAFSFAGGLFAGPRVAGLPAPLPALWIWIKPNGWWRSLPWYAPSPWPFSIVGCSRLYRNSEAPMPPACPIFCVF